MSKAGDCAIELRRVAMVAIKLRRVAIVTIKLRRVAMVTIELRRVAMVTIELRRVVKIKVAMILVNCKLKNVGTLHFRMTLNNVKHNTENVAVSGIQRIQHIKQCESSNIAKHLQRFHEITIILFIFPCKCKKSNFSTIHETMKNIHSVCKYELLKKEQQELLNIVNTTVNFLSCTLDLR